MSVEAFIVALIVLAAVVFVVRRMTGYVPKTKPKKGPDVPVSRLVRRKPK